VIELPVGAPDTDGAPDVAPRTEDAPVDRVADAETDE
jgi:hypothetical protein